MDQNPIVKTETTRGTSRQCLHDTGVGTPRQGLHDTGVRTPRQSP